MPTWMEFVTFPKGQGFTGLLILYNSEDDDTSCNGKLRVEIYGDCEYKEKLWSKSFDVGKYEFSEYTWGINRGAIAWHLKRIPYDEIEPDAEDPVWYVRAYFESPDGCILKDTSVI